MGLDVCLSIYSATHFSRLNRCHSGESLADKDTNSILTDDANRAIPGKCRHLVANFESDANW